MRATRRMTRSVAAWSTTLLFAASAWSPAWSDETPPPAYYTRSHHLGFSSRTDEVLACPVQLRKDGNLDLLLVNEDFLAETLGLGHEVDRGSTLRKLALDWALSGSTSGDRLGVASRYSRPDDRRIQGDGRTAKIGELQPIGGGLSLDIQLQGIPTPLAPTQTTPDRSNGQKPLREAACDVIVLQFLQTNLVPGSRWLGLFRDGQGHARLVRAGRFERVAQLYQLGASDAARDYLDELGRKFAQEEGVESLSHSDLYRALVWRAASLYSRLFWLRVVHGAASYDNTFFFGFGDSGRTRTLVRPHRDFTPSNNGPGFAHEGLSVLTNMYGRELVGILRSMGRPLDAEIDPDVFVRGAYVHHMSANMLEHLGFEDHEAAMLLREKPTETGQLLSAFLEIVHAGGELPPGPQGGEAAQFDAFAAIGALASTHGRRDAALKVAEAMAPLDNVVSPELAQKLIDPFGRLAEHLLSDLDAEERREKIRMWTEEARRINEPVPELAMPKLDRFVDEWLGRFAGNRDAARAELQALDRKTDRRGKNSPREVAKRLRERTAELTPDRQGIVLSRVNERGTRIEEITDTVKDSMRVTYQLPWSWGMSPSEVQMLYKTSKDGAWEKAKPVSTKDKEGRATFEVELPASPEHFECKFRVGVNKDDNGGMNYGCEYRPATRSRIVNAYLGHLAKERGLSRPGIPAAAVRAVSRTAR